MYEFIVLGMVPGTNIQISFELWLKLVAGVSAYALLCAFAIWTYRFFKFTDQLLSVRGDHSPVSASQLHQRAQ